MTLFHAQELRAKFLLNFSNLPVIVYGEAYGGKQQGMSNTYGKELRFIVFDVKVGECWLDVPSAKQVVTKLGLSFVSFARIPTTLEAIDTERDRDSVQAVLNGAGVGKMREGVVLRPLVEFTKNNGNRVICKHKRPEFAEHAHQPKVVSPDKLEVLADANKVADQWVTTMRLRHVLDKNLEIQGMEQTQLLIRAMTEDIKRESEHEVVWSKEVSSTIGRKTAQVFKQFLQNKISSSFGADPDCRPEPVVPWDNRGWQPDGKENL